MLVALSGATEPDRGRTERGGAPRRSRREPPAEPRAPERAVPKGRRWKSPGGPRGQPSRGERSEQRRAGPELRRGPKPDRGSAATEVGAGSATATDIYINKHHPHIRAPYEVGGASVWARASTTDACSIAMGSSGEARHKLRGATRRPAVEKLPLIPALVQSGTGVPENQGATRPSAWT